MAQDTNDSIGNVAESISAGAFGPAAAAVLSDGPKAVVQSLDAAYFSDRFQFSWIENPRATWSSANAPRDYKESATVRISNDGTSPLEIDGATLQGPFALANPSAVIGKTIAPGQYLDVAVNFVRALYLAPTDNAASGVFSGALNLATNDPVNPLLTVELAGFWQAMDENNWEPNINEVWQVFGFGNFIPNVPTT